MIIPEIFIHVQYSVYCTRFIRTAESQLMTKLFYCKTVKYLMHFIWSVIIITLVYNNTLSIIYVLNQCIKCGSWKTRKGGKWRKVAEKSGMHHSAFPRFQGNGGMPSFSLIFDFLHQN